MKYFWLPLAIIVLLTAGTLTNVFYLSHITSELTQTLEQAQAFAESGQSEQAIQLTRQAQTAFERCSFYLHVTLNHQSIDNAETTFGEVLEHLRLHETGSIYTAANAKLLTLLELIAESEQLTLKNLL